MILIEIYRCSFNICFKRNSDLEYKFEKEIKINEKKSRRMMVKRNAHRFHYSWHVKNNIRKYVGMYYILSQSCTSCVLFNFLLSYACIFFLLNIYFHPHSHRLSNNPHQFSKKLFLKRFYGNIGSENRLCSTLRLLFKTNRRLASVSGMLT